MDATGSPMSASVPTMGSSLNLGTSVGLKQGFKRQPSLAGFKERSLGPTHPTLLPPQWGWLCLLFESHQIKHIVSPFNQTTEEPLKNLSFTQIAHWCAKKFLLKKAAHIALEESNA